MTHNRRRKDHLRYHEAFLNFGIHLMNSWLYDRSQQNLFVLGVATNHASFDWPVRNPSDIWPRTHWSTVGARSMANSSGEVVRHVEESLRPDALAPLLCLQANIYYIWHILIIYNNWSATTLDLKWNALKLLVLSKVLDNFVLFS